MLITKKENKDISVKLDLSRKCDRKNTLIESVNLDHASPEISVSNISMSEDKKSIDMVISGGKYRKLKKGEHFHHEAMFLLRLKNLSNQIYCKPIHVMMEK